MGQFEKWLQERLIIHGYNSVKPDGDWGRTSIDALKKFQFDTKLKVSGVADNPTVAALKQSPTGVVSVAAPVETMPPWMAELNRKAGLHEVKNNSSLIDFLKIGRYLGNPKDLPWCGDAVESVIAKTLPTEKLPSNPFFAQNWAKFGQDAGGPIVGSIGVIKWSPTSGHVGIVAGVDGNRVNMLGGNQSNAINVSSFPRDKFIAFRWPTTFPVKQYPAMKGKAVALSEASTR